VHGQEFAGLEPKALGSSGKLKEINYPARTTTDIDDVAPLHAVHGDLDWNGHHAARHPPPH
jgi:hypothetical protein